MVKILFVVNFYIVLLNLIVTLYTNIADIDKSNRLLEKKLQKKSKEKRQKKEFKDYNIPSEQILNGAIKDIAYYLREYKFNEWDRRYYQQKPGQNLVGFFGTFPTPSLRTLHWKVKLKCRNDFYECINYLYSVVESVPCLRVNNTAAIKNNKFDLLKGTMTKIVKDECKERKSFEEKMGLPFDDPIEKFQWCTTAAYYMCWYTMLGIPALSMIGERCDNFANCLDGDFSSDNHDPRADDKFSFQCAKYSFCPDLCCPIKHIESMITCYNDKSNPCFAENNERDSLQRMCLMDHKYNQNFKDIVYNRWNITCNCPDGFQWKSDFGMCVDINECLFETNNCDIISQHCINVPGAYLCVCKLEFELDEKKQNCVRRNFTVQ